jgi:hypothetical protein
MVAADDNPPSIIHQVVESRRDEAQINVIPTGLKVLSFILRRINIRRYHIVLTGLLQPIIPINKLKCPILMFFTSKWGNILRG